jgi:hypothetical protein
MESSGSGIVPWRTKAPEFVCLLFEGHKNANYELLSVKY